MGVNPLRLHCLLKALDYIVCLVEFGGHNLNDLHPIRPVEFDWHLKPLTGNVIYLNGLTPNLTGHNLNGFTPNSTGRIGCKSIEIDAG